MLKTTGFIWSIKETRSHYSFRLGSSEASDIITHKGYGGSYSDLSSLSDGKFLGLAYLRQDDTDKKALKALKVGTEVELSSIGPGPGDIEQFIIEGVK